MVLDRITQLSLRESVCSEKFRFFEFMRTEVLTTNLFDCFYLRAGAPLVRNLVLLKLCGLKSSLRTYLIVFI
jgi:hypothetical protein